MPLPYDPAIALLGIYLKEMKTYIHRNLYTNVHSSFIHNSFIQSSQKQPKYPLTSERLNKLWYIHTKEYHSAIKRNKQVFFLFCFVLFCFVFIYLFLFLAALGLCCCAQAFSSCGEQGPLFVAVRGLLIGWLLLLQSTGSRCAGFSSRGTRAP